MRYYTLILICAPFFAICQTDLWTHYGGDASGKRYSTLDQINVQNVENLEVAWSFQTGERGKYPAHSDPEEKAAFEATPIQVDQKIYFPSPTNQIFCLNLTDGEEIWRFDPGINMYGDFSEVTSRGVSYWKGRINGNEVERILFGTIDGRLISLDAKTGYPDSSFNLCGFVDLKVGVGRIQVTSAPSIYENAVITGSSVGDNGRADLPRGVIRAYNIENGVLLWSWDPLDCQSDARFVGAANAWSTTSLDHESGILFVPTSSPSPDFYGGLRPGKNACANSLVALDALTGELKWSFQVVEHDLWDYDIAAQPVLFNFQDSIPAVAVGTKMGHIYVLDRATGKALLPFEYKPVPSSNIPTEKPAARQKFPVLPPPLGKNNIDEADIWGPTEAEREISLEQFRQLSYNGIFTPPAEGEGTLVFPGNVGGIHWGGMSIDPDQGLLVTNINHMAHIVSLKERHDIKAFEQFQQKMQDDGNQIDPDYTAMLGAPYFMSRTVFAKLNDQGDFWIQTSPPWGELVGIKINSGEIAWRRPLGIMMDTEKYPDAVNYGALNLGGAITTAGDLTFVAATVDGYIRAFQTSTGKLLWEYKLPAAGIATPMIAYHGGREYLVIAAGGHGKISFTQKGDYILAFALPE